MTDHLSPLFSWRSAITDSGLSPTTRLVALVLSLHMNERGGSCYPSQATLARESGLHEDTVKDHLRQLREAGWLTAVPCQGKTTRYTGVLPTGFSPLSTTGGSTTPGSRTPGGAEPPPPRGPRPPRGGVQDPPEDDRRTTEGRQPPQPPRSAGGRPNPSCVWCEGTGWMTDDEGENAKPCGCSRAPDRKRTAEPP